MRVSACAWFVWIICDCQIIYVVGLGYRGWIQVFGLAVFIVKDLRTWQWDSKNWIWVLVLLWLRIKQRNQLATNYDSNSFCLLFPWVWHPAFFCIKTFLPFFELKLVQKLQSGMFSHPVLPHYLLPHHSLVQPKQFFAHPLVQMVRYFWNRCHSFSSSISFLLHFLIACGRLDARWLLLFSGFLCSSLLL